MHEMPNIFWEKIYIYIPNLSSVECKSQNMYKLINLVENIKVYRVPVSMYGLTLKVPITTSADIYLFHFSEKNKLTIHIKWHVLLSLEKITKTILKCSLLQIRFVFLRVDP